MRFRTGLSTKESELTSARCRLSAASSFAQSKFALHPARQKYPLADYPCAPGAVLTEATPARLRATLDLSIPSRVAARTAGTSLSIEMRKESQRAQTILKASVHRTGQAGDIRT
jgi:hypothetical protein